MSKKLKLKIELEITASDKFAEELLNDPVRLYWYVLRASYRNNARHLVHCTAEDITPPTIEERRRDLLQYLAKLRAHDWTYARADSSEAYRKGQEANQALRSEARRDDSKRELFEQYDNAHMKAKAVLSPTVVTIEAMLAREFNLEVSI